MTKANLDTLIADLKNRCAMCVSDEAGACLAEDRMKCWMHHDRRTVTPIGPNETVSLNAMIAYVAHMTKQNEFKVEKAFVNTFCIPNVKCLPIEQYTEALRFLADQIPPAEAHA